MGTTICLTPVGEGACTPLKPFARNPWSVPCSRLFLSPLCREEEGAVAGAVTGGAGSSARALPLLRVPEPSPSGLTPRLPACDGERVAAIAMETGGGGGTLPPG